RHRGGLQGFGLRDGARKAVEQVALRTVALLEALLDQTHDDVVGNELPRVHQLFRRGAERRAGLDRRAQHVSGGDLRDLELGRDLGRLRALARAWRAQQDQTHGLWFPPASILRTASRSCGVSTPGGMSCSVTSTAMR